MWHRPQPRAKREVSDRRRASRDRWGCQGAVEVEYSVNGSKDAALVMLEWEVRAYEKQRKEEREYSAAHEISIRSMKMPLEARRPFACCKLPVKEDAEVKGRLKTETRSSLAGTGH